MLKNYLKTALRNLRRNKAYTAINIFGLSVSLAVAIVLFKVIVFELSFDDYHKNIPHIYQLLGKDKYAETGSHVPQGVTTALKRNFPGVERAAVVYNWTPQVIKANNKNFQQKNCYFIQPEWLRMIDVEWIKGSPESSLTLPSKVVLDEPTAKRLFGNEDPMGKIIRFNNKEDLAVSGIIKKVPANSQYPMEMMVSYETVKILMPWYKNDDYWYGGDSYFHGYVQLKPGASISAIEAGINKLVKEHADKSSYSSFSLVPMRVNHFDTVNDVFNYAIPKWLLYAWGSIGVFLLLIACINFINIATVQAFQRNRETGIRKILGSSKWQIIAQFFTETAVLVIISVAIAACLANFVLPYTGRLLNTHVGETAFWNIDIVIFLGLISLTVVLFSGAYPAIVLSGFKPVQLLRSRFFTPSKGISLRQSLVVTQFVIAQVLVICTLIGAKQINFLYQKDLGFNKASVVTVNMPEPRDKILRERLRRQLQGASDIDNVTFGLTTPSSRSSWWWTGVKHHALANGEQQWREQFIDANYFSFFNIPVIAGKQFSLADSTNAVAMINETAMRDLGFQQPEQAIGQQLTINDEKYTVSGIVRDYVSQSLKSNLTPHIYFYNGFYETAIIRIKDGRQAQALKNIEREWQQVFPDYFFSPTFLDEDLKEFYSNESKLASFVSLLALIGIVIGCLGVYGLVSFICIRRTKEIGVRKVLGASLANILVLLSSEFMRLIAIAFVVATPIAWYIMNKFLQDYTYRTPIPWWVFLLSGGGALLITFITISFQAVKAALENPVKSLRTE